MQQSVCYRWTQRCLYQGRFKGDYQWQHIGDSLIVALHQPFMFHAGNDQRLVQLAYIPANEPCRLQFKGHQAAFLSSHFWLNDIGTFRSNYNFDYLGNSVVQSRVNQDIVTRLTQLQKLQPSAEIARQSVSRIINPDSVQLPSFSMDKRVRQLIQLILSRPSATGSLDQYTSEFNLTGPYLNRLFKEHTGMPVARFRLGVRVLSFIQQFMHSRNLTIAAHEAGFSDLAHLNKCHRLLFGTCPSKLWLPPSKLTMHSTFHA